MVHELRKCGDAGNQHFCEEDQEKNEVDNPIQDGTQEEKDSRLRGLLENDYLGGLRGQDIPLAILEHSNPLSG